MKELSKDAQYVGEDGDIVCNATTKKDAFIKFKRKILEDCGKDDIEDMTIEDVGKCYLLLVEKDNRDPELFDSEWYVSYSEKKKSNYQLYFYGS